MRIAVRLLTKYTRIKTPNKPITNAKIVAKIVVTFLTIYCISFIVAYFYNISITFLFPFSFSEGTHVPEHRLKAI